MIAIRCQNLNKSLDAQQDFINSINPNSVDIIAIQEPYINFQGNTRSNQHWYSIYPDSQFIDNANKTRSIIMINKQIPSDLWQVIDMKSTDATAILLCTAETQTLVINVYNAQDLDDSLDAIKDSLQQCDLQCKENDPPEHMLWLSNVNRHHPMWEEDCNNHLLTLYYIDNATPLIDLLADHNMLQMLPKGIPTLRAMVTGNHTRPDNVFATSEL